MIGRTYSRDMGGRPAKLSNLQEARRVIIRRACAGFALVVVLGIISKDAARHDVDSLQGRHLCRYPRHPRSDIASSELGRLLQRRLF